MLYRERHKVGMSYDFFANIYDYDMAKNIDKKDIQLYKKYSKGCVSPIIEIGIGTGRVALPLVEDGHIVYGVDNSEKMVEVMRSKHNGTKPVVLMQDIENMDLPQNYFSIAIGSFSIFTHLLERKDQISFLGNSYDSLVRNGLLIIDVFKPNLTFLVSENGIIYFDYTREIDKNRYFTRRKKVNKISVINQTNEIILMYELFSDGMLIEKREFIDRIRYVYYIEMVNLLELCGFKVENVFGDYDESPLTDDSKQMIFICRKV